MEISREADYAVRAVLHLALEPEDRRVTSAEIARTQNVPPAFLTKILSRLTAAGIVDSRRGVRGGVKLRLRPAEISLLNVIEAVDGPIRLNRCLIRPGECPRDTYCAVHPAWRQIGDELRNRLAGISFASLAQQQKARRRKKSRRRAQSET